MHRWRQTCKGKNITYIIVNNNGSNTVHGIWEPLIKSRGKPSAGWHDSQKWLQTYNRAVCVHIFFSCPKMWWLNSWTKCVLLILDNTGILDDVQHLRLKKKKVLKIVSVSIFTQKQERDSLHWWAH